MNPKEEFIGPYFLASLIVILTGLGVCLLIYFICKEPEKTTQKQLEISLSIIAVSLIVEAILILSILNIPSDHYEALYAAIAGYVLGRVGAQKDDKKIDQQQKQPEIKQELGKKFEP